MLITADLIPPSGFQTILSFWTLYEYKVIPTLRKFWTKTWYSKNDLFKHHLENMFLDLNATKRNIISMSSRLFANLDFLWALVMKSIILIPIPLGLKMLYTTKIQIHGFSDTSIRVYGYRIYVYSKFGDKHSCLETTYK